MVGATAAPGPLTRADAEHWYAELGREAHGWVIEVGGACVGVARLHHVDPAVGEGWLAVGLFAPEHRGRGYGTEAVHLLLAHAFCALDLVAVRLRVLAFNRRALACYQRCGFHEVGREPVTLSAEATEDILMAVTRAEANVAPAAYAGESP